MICRDAELIGCALSRSFDPQALGSLLFAISAQFDNCDDVAIELPSNDIINKYHLANVLTPRRLGIDDHPRHRILIITIIIVVVVIIVIIIGLDPSYLQAQGSWSS